VIAGYRIRNSQLQLKPVYFYLTQALQRAALRHPDAIATVCQGRRRSYRELAQRVARLAGALQRLGVGPGERVGMLALNSDRYLEFYLGAWWAGAVVNPVNVRWSPAEIAFSLDDCDTRVLLIDDAFVPMAEALRERSRALRTLIYVGDQNAPKGIPDYEAVLATASAVPDAQRRDAQLAGIFYTGGTTGRPKGVMLSHANLTVFSYLSLVELPLAENTSQLAVLPMFHLAALAQILRSFARAGRQVVLPTFEPGEVLRAIAAERVEQTALVPTMLQLLLDHPRFTDHDITSLRLIAYGASPISEALLERAMSGFPQAQFAQAYGMTETSAGTCYLTPEHHCARARAAGRLRSAGRPLTGVDLRVVDEMGRELPRGSVGELTVRSPAVMLGYWNRPEETERALRDGWLHSGDAGYMDADGFVYLVDRLKDMIVSGGENVYSAEVENALARHPAVAACAVIGIPDERWGEAVHAAVVLRPGAATDEDELRRHCRDQIAGYKCPRSIEFREELPLSAAGKVLKYALREPHWQGRDRSVS
jgi:acyl-CoA synthetase (AMP-forming)/AMP-acid ligase II